MKYVDYYKVLQVDRGTSQEDISKSYKKLARKYHPDLNKDPGAEAKFKELNEAYEVLKDPDTRNRYDTLGANWKHGAPFEPPPGWGQNIHFDFGGGSGGGIGSSGFSDFFESILGGRGGQPGGGFGGRGGRPSPGMGGGGINLDELLGGFGGGRQGPRRGSDVESILSIQLEDTYKGNQRTVELSGSSGKRRYDVKIPRGVRDGERIRLANQGRPGPGGSNGDLYLTIKLAPHPQFQVEGDDLVVTVKVDAWDAALGASIPVPTLDGEVQMTLPPGLSSGQRLRLRGKGLPRRDDRQGDLYAELKIAVPGELSPEQKKLFTRLRDIAD